MKQMILLIFGVMVSITQVFGQFKSNYPDIPRIDVHTHVAGDISGISNYLSLGELLREEKNIDMALWINLGDRNTPLLNIVEVEQAGKGRMLCGIADFKAHDGLSYAPESLKKFKEQGFVGYKIWSGPWYRTLKKKEDGYPYIDDPAHEATFAEMERIGFMGASIHVADPNGPFGNRTAWLADPIEYWTQINAWRNVLEKHPDLRVVMAHANWLICQDAQIDYLRNMLATFPNLNIDLAATFQYYHLVDRENLRSFMIEWADRIVFGTDIGNVKNEEISQRAEQYSRAFQILETGDMVNGGFFGGPETLGLELPREVLEKIYYKNAMRLYPRVKDGLAKLGYGLGDSK
ncbi:amidohydrolase family protein [Cyclobacterium sp. 1_MG-2023]|uniref:amidohydrolase family protein n=1 Tax=Cyclobacterium sp. 1_MG-2023 TaxID=3062681 RepID=UPI0026E3068B|nr:amidohydrolase family protein [Cyclobacterium sp. 1_MG-2023]MDO6440011.1 amidohydrolase family protein [Cyclobacterium sp. 1_MG-2023]